MNARKATLALLALLTLTLASCGTLRRAGKDVFIGAATATALLPIYAGATDGYASAVSAREGLDAGASLEVLVFPFTFVWHFVEHTAYGVIHIVDLPLCLFYWPVELHPYGPEIKPLDFYQGTIFDEAESPSGTDAESGQPMMTGTDR